MDRPHAIDLHSPEAYGHSFADVYDEWYHRVTDAEATARFVAARCGPGPVLELGVGSGRLARPMAAAGVNVIGLDGSAAMLGGASRCNRSGGGGAAIACVLADMRALPFGRPVPAILVAFNTLFNLPTEADQRSLFGEAARLLTPDGVLIVEALDATPLVTGPATSLGVRHRGPSRLVVTATQLDRPTQVVTGHHLEIGDAGVAARPWILRWSTPDQLDAMATDAKLGLDERFGDWQGAPFDRPGETHISVYRPVG